MRRPRPLKHEAETTVGEKVHFVNQHQRGGGRPSQTGTPKGPKTHTPGKVDGGKGGEEKGLVEGRGTRLPFPQAAKYRDRLTLRPAMENDTVPGRLDGWTVRGRQSRRKQQQLRRATNGGPKAVGGPKRGRAAATRRRWSCTQRSMQCRQRSSVVLVIKCGQAGRETEEDSRGAGEGRRKEGRGKEEKEEGNDPTFFQLCFHFCTFRTFSASSEPPKPK
ncbi:hypothetical protein BO71DRAFT_161084 [Aspergillus ellipticus CBS 707.79]|uniref:Uncharacterized protein n=1 Tax=Aspergillus ellipticus CBS 707.79 TaxID=1448320 RepID=A0A319DHR5_9EURO|nr:hypothetical protein BO71DRAFT_161084 [Aspergillus ellipticus CBS 707.79]